MTERQQTWKHPNLAAALAAAQAEYPKIPRSVEVTVIHRDGRKHTWRYAPLDTILSVILPVLSRHELALTQIVDSTTLVTRLVHVSGDAVESEMPLPDPDLAKISNQEYGAIITYRRRYSLEALLGLAASDDDDANVADGHEVIQSHPVKRVEPADNVQRDEANHTHDARPQGRQAITKVQPPSERLIVGTIVGVSTKEGETHGKKWVLHKITIRLDGDGDIVVTTFDDKIGDLVRKLQDKRISAEIHSDGRGWRLDSVEACPVGKGPGEADTAEDEGELDLGGSDDGEGESGEQTPF